MESKFRILSFGKQPILNCEALAILREVRNEELLRGADVEELGGLSAQLGPLKRWLIALEKNAAEPVPPKFIVEAASKGGVTSSSDSDNASIRRLENPSPPEALAALKRLPFPLSEDERSWLVNYRPQNAQTIACVFQGSDSTSMEAILAHNEADRVAQGNGEEDTPDLALGYQLIWRCLHDRRYACPDMYEEQGQRDKNFVASSGEVSSSGTSSSTNSNKRRKTTKQASSEKKKRRSVSSEGSTHDCDGQDLQGGEISS
ncbi:unnamed protein product [Amoebophrya sp. A25]|nr:unnamed protein product [Amoebophrya sp. A25]|eukprot:GSA25T00018114001.1